MNRILITACTAGLILVGGGAGAESLRSADSFAGIGDDRARAAAIFTEMARVLTHPRCINCHPRGDSPRQGEEMALHQPPVTRGAGGMGMPGMQCPTCHGAENISYVGAAGSIPGQEVWHLAPAEMGWIGLSAAGICAQIKDPARNGGRDLSDLVEHLAEDGLVGWAWQPGAGRAPAPGTQAELGALARTWVEAGAHCPE